MLDPKRLHLRAAFFRLVREFFSQGGFLEVDTPLRQPVYIPESNITPLAVDGQYLQTSPELCMKRLLAAGNNKIFQICPCFRKEERGRLHLEEFQMLEWYRTGADYRQLMLDCESLLQFLLRGLDSLQFTDSITVLSFFAGIDFSGHWQRLTVAEAFFRYSPMPLDQVLRQDKFDEILVEFIEPHLGKKSPAFLYDYPLQLGSLARRKTADPTVAERFELYINGVEIANGFSELTDAWEQRERFAHEIAVIKTNSGRDAVMPERFLADLDKLTSAAGIALGLDRLFMSALNLQTIGEAVPFAPDDF